MLRVPFIGQIYLPPIAYQEKQKRHIVEKPTVMANRSRSDGNRSKHLLARSIVSFEEVINASACYRPIILSISRYVFSSLLFSFQSTAWINPHYIIYFQQLLMPY